MSNSAWKLLDRIGSLIGNAGHPGGASLDLKGVIIAKQMLYDMRGWPRIVPEAVFEAIEREWRVKLDAEQREHLNKCLVARIQWHWYSRETKSSRHRGRGRPPDLHWEMLIIELWRACRRAGGNPSVSWRDADGNRETPFVRGAAELLSCWPPELGRAPTASKIGHRMSALKRRIKFRSSRKAGRPKRRN